jgi:hypothetical protein
MRVSSVRQSVDNEAAEDAGPECRDALAGAEKDKLAPLGQSHRGSIRLPGDVPDSSKLLARVCDCLLQSVGRETPPPVFWMRPRSYIQVAAAHERVAEIRRKNAATLDHTITFFDEQDAIVPVLEYPKLVKQPECKEWIPRRIGRQKFLPGRLPHLDAVRLGQLAVRTRLLNAILYVQMEAHAMK